MQIQIKQHEIVTALKQYITQQGINLLGKTVSVSFIAGRKGSGITADVLIDEEPIPGFETGGADEPVKSEGVVGTIGPKAVETSEPTVPTAESDGGEPVEAPKEAAAAEESRGPKTTSLFN